MATLPDDVNPFRRTSVYSEFGLDPFASVEEIDQEFERLSASFASLSDEEKLEKLQALQESQAVLRDPVRRVQLNALLLDTLDTKAVVERLQGVADVDLSDAELPTLDPGQLLVEGQSPEMLLAGGDATDVAPDPELELDLDEMRQSMAGRVGDAQYLFDS